MIPLPNLLSMPLMLLCASISAAERWGYPVDLAQVSLFGMSSGP
jgi:hypothetical protein